jgi:uncharacterized protein
MTSYAERLHDRLMRRPRSLVGGLAAIGLAAILIAAATLRLDLSFRPLFADDPGMIEAAAEFEARFGQPSGAHVGLLLLRDTPLTPDFVRILAGLSSELADLPEVSDVLGPGRLVVPRWQGGEARAEWLIDPERIASSPAAAERAAEWLLTSAEAAPFVRDGGRSLLVLVRTDLPLSDLAGRAALVERIEERAAARLPADVVRHLVGVSVVEAAYARAILEGMLRSLLLTSAAIVLMLLLVFGRLRDVVVVLAGVGIGTPATMAVMGVLGREITLLTSMVPTVVLVIGTADAIHLRRRWEAERRAGRPSEAAVRRTFRALSVPCLLTTITTAAGFLSLGAARITAIRDFGTSVAIGVALVFVANLLLVPALLRLIGDGRGAGAGAGAGAGVPGPCAISPRPSLEPLTGALGRVSGAVTSGAARLATRPVLPLALTAAALVPLLLGIGRLQVEQRFNEELGPDEPVRAGQAILEETFGGFLGPEVELARTDGGSMLDAHAVAGMRRAVDRLAAHPLVHRVESPLGWLAGAPGEPDVLHAGLASLSVDPALGARLREVYDTRSGHAALHVRIGDVGTRRALEIADWIRVAAREELGEGFDVRIRGQWHLAQVGMASLLRDMIASFAVSLLLVLPLVALALRSSRALLLAVLPNLLPAAAALAWMGWTGTTLRIGTVLVLSVALAIGVDDSIHLLARTREARLAGQSPERAIRTALRETGLSLILTTLVLSVGFLSMLSNDLAAIRDMGVVATVAIVTALLADLYVLPPVYVLLERRSAPVRHRERPDYVSRPMPGASPGGDRWIGNRPREIAGTDTSGIH